MSRKLVLLAFISFFILTVLVSQIASSQSMANGQCVIPQSGAVNYPDVSIDRTLAETVHNLDTGLSYTTIQAAIDAVETLDGHTILVDAGVYFERVVVSKSISLTGQNTSTTIIDGGGTGTVVNIIKSNINVTGFTMQNSGVPYTEAGIYLNNANHCIITGNNIANNSNGVWFSSSSGNTFSGNNIANNYHYGVWFSSSSGNTVSGNNIANNDWDGVQLESSSNNTLRGNVMVGNGYSFGVSGSSFSHFINDVDASNTVDGKPVYYWIDKKDMAVPLDAGYVALVNCTCMTVQNLNLTSNVQGVLLAYTTNSTITKNNIANNGYCGVWFSSSSGNTVSGNNITDNWRGIWLYFSSNNSISKNNVANNKYEGVSLLHSSNNMISGNDIKANNGTGIWLLVSSNNMISGNDIKANNGIGIWLLVSSNNMIYHNNFVNNTDQVGLTDSFNDTLDNGLEGNYWSNYVGVDLDHDGIGETPHIIDANNNDSCPLMGMFHSFNTSLGKHVNVISNSTIENFEYFESTSTIRMYVSGEPAYGFCRTCILYELMNATSISVIIDDGATITLHPNYALYDNGTHGWIYFAYQHSTHKIDIIPEFPSLLILPLFMTATLIVALVCKKKSKV